MELIKSKFSIKDLENLSGIKAHTIRIWEKRYNLLEPERTETNIRFYSNESLQKLLNIALLNKYGMKISKIAKLTDEQIIEESNSLINEKATKALAINNFKIAMYNFDTMLFNKTYDDLLNKFSFQEVFNNYFIPFLDELGLLWQTDTISPANEHFISALIKQKVLIEVEKIQYRDPIHTSEVFILFLPDQEIHDLGLIYVHYLLLSKGFKSIFLGQSIPIENLSGFKELFNKITFISYFTVKPSVQKIASYIKQLNEKIIELCDCKLWVMGRKTTEIDLDDIPKNTEIINSISDLIKKQEYIIKNKIEAS